MPLPHLQQARSKFGDASPRRDVMPDLIQTSHDPDSAPGTPFVVPARHGDIPGTIALEFQQHGERFLLPRSLEQSQQRALVLFVAVVAVPSNSADARDLGRVILVQFEVAHACHVCADLDFGEDRIFLGIVFDRRCHGEPVHLARGENRFGDGILTYSTGFGEEVIAGEPVLLGRWNEMKNIIDIRVRSVDKGGAVPRIEIIGRTEESLEGCEGSELFCGGGRDGDDHGDEDGEEEYDGRAEGKTEEEGSGVDQGNQGQEAYGNIDDDGGRSVRNCLAEGREGIPDQEFEADQRRQRDHQSETQEP